MGRNSKQKGNAFERKVARMIAEAFGVDRSSVRRTPLSGGDIERGDIVMSLDLLNKFPFFIECRNRKSWSWENLIQRRDNSVLGRWYFEDAVGKCHPHEGVERIPLLVFTKPYAHTYAMTSSVYPDPLAKFNSVTGPLLWVPTNKGLLVVEKFESVLLRYVAENTQKELGETNEEEVGSSEGDNNARSN